MILYLNILRYLFYGIFKGNIVSLIKDLVKLLRGVSFEELYSIFFVLYELKLGSGVYLIELLVLVVFFSEFVRVVGVNIGLL